MPENAHVICNFKSLKQHTLRRIVREEQICRFAKNSSNEKCARHHLHAPNQFGIYGTGFYS